MPVVGSRVLKQRLDLGFGLGQGIVVDESADSCDAGGMMFGFSTFIPKWRWWSIMGSFFITLEQES